MTDHIRIVSIDPLRLEWPCGCQLELCQCRRFELMKDHWCYSDVRCAAEHPEYDPSSILSGIALGMAMRKAGRT